MNRHIHIFREILIVSLFAVSFALFASSISNAYSAKYDSLNMMWKNGEHYHVYQLIKNMPTANELTDLGVADNIALSYQALRESAFEMKEEYDNRREIDMENLDNAFEYAESGDYEKARGIVSKMKDEAKRFSDWPFYEKTDEILVGLVPDCQPLSDKQVVELETALNSFDGILVLKKGDEITFDSLFWKNSSKLDKLRQFKNLELRYVYNDTVYCESRILKRLRDYGAAINSGEKRVMPKIVSMAKNYITRLEQIQKQLDDKDLELVAMKDKLEELTEITSKLTMIMKTANLVQKDSLKEHSDVVIGADPAYDMWQTGIKSSIGILNAQREIMQSKLENNRSWLDNNRQTLETYKKSLQSLEETVGEDSSVIVDDLRMAIGRNKQWADSVSSLKPTTASNLWIWLIVGIVGIMIIMLILISRSKSSKLIEDN